MSWLDSLGQYASGIGEFTGLDDAWHDMTLAFTDAGEDDSIFMDIGQYLRGTASTFAAAPKTLLNTLNAASHYATAGVGYLDSLSMFQGVRLGAGMDLGPGSQYANAETKDQLFNAARVGESWAREGETFDQYKNRAFDSTIGGSWDDGLSLGEIMTTASYGAETVSGAAGFGLSRDPLSWTSAERDRAFRDDDAPFKAVSGSTDLVYGTVLDPSNLLPGAGKAARLAAAGKYIVVENPGRLAGAFKVNATAVEKMLDEAVTESGSGLNKHFTWLAASDFTTILRSPEARRSGNASLFAHMFGEAKTVEEVRDTYTVLARLGSDEGIQAAKDRLISANAARGGVPQETDYLIDNIINGRPGVEAADDLGFVADQRLDAIFTKYLASDDSALSRAYGRKLDEAVANPVPVIERAPGTNAYLRWNERIATKRAGMAGTAMPEVTVAQPTAAHPVMAVARWAGDNKVSNYFTRPRSSGILNAHDADSVNEIAALIDDIDRETGGAMQGGLGRNWLNLYGAASTETDRMRIALAIERKGLELIGEKFGISGEAARELWQASFERRAKALADHRERGFVSYLLDSGDTAVVKMPILERQNVNALPLLDFGQVSKAIDRHGAGVLNGVVKDAAGSVVGAMDVINDVFKISVLLRLGYTIRNMTEAFASLFVSGYLGSILMSAGRDAAESFVTHRRAQAYRLMDKAQVATGRKRDIAVLLDDDNKAAAAVRAAEGVLEGVRAAALSRANIHLTDGDIDLLQRLRATEVGSADEFAPLSPEELTQAQELRQSLTSIAELRSETTRRTTYHATDNPEFSSIDGDWIDTTPSSGVAAANADRVNTILSWETASNGINLNMAVVRTKDASGEWVTRPSRSRLEAGYHKMLDEAQSALDSGLAVERRTPTGWRPVTAEQLDDLRTRTYRRGMERTVLRTRDASKRPGVVEVPSYGEELDLTNLASWPEDLKSALGITHPTPRHTAQRRRNRPSFKEWVDREAWNEDETAQALAEYARANGYGRIILPSKQWGQTVRVLRENADDFGGRGASTIVDRKLDEVIREAVETGEASALPHRGYRADNRAARRELRQRSRLARGPRARLNGRPVVPGYDRDHVATMMDQGIIPAVKQASEDLVRRKAWHEQTRTALSDGLRRQERMSVKPQEKLGARDIEIATEMGPVRVPGAFAGSQGEIMWRRTHGDANYEALVGDGSQILSQAIGQSVPTKISPNEPRYFEAWSNILNWHWRDPSSGRIDPLVERLLNGQSPADLAGWMRTGEGRAYRDQFGWTDEQAEVAAERLAQALPIYLPDGETIALWRAGRLDPASLSDRFGGRPDLPEVNGLLVPQSREYADQASMADLVSMGARKLFHFLGALPETAWARHPMYRAYYAREMQRIVPEAIARKGGALTLDEVNTIASTVRERGRQEVNKTLFTIIRRTGASQQLRLIAPFYAAWENVLQRWGRFAVNDTERLALGAHYIGRAMSNATIVNNETGEPAKLGDIPLDQASMVLPFKVQGWDARVPVASLDVVFQGQPMNPGIGPFVAFPLVKVMEAQPRAEQILEWAFPAGIPKDAGDVFLAAWLRRATSMVQEDQSFINDANRIAQMEYIRYQRGERTDLPAWTEIKDKTRQFYGLRMFTNLTAPFAVQYTNDVNYYSEELRRYKATYGEDQGELKFLEDRPEAFVVMQPLSDNRGGVRANYDAVDNLKRYQDLTAQAEAFGDDRMLGWLANYGQGEYDPSTFSEAAYNWQLANAPVPGAENYRSRKNPAEIYTDAQVYKGWVQFRGVMDAIESQLTTAGLDISNPGVQEQLKDARSILADSIGQLNPEWNLDYRTTDRARFDRRADFFESVLTDDQFLADHGDDQDLRYISTFLDMRGQLQAELQFRDSQGGSKSLETQSNADLANFWNTRILQMKQESLGFADWYERYFSNDPVVI